MHGIIQIMKKYVVGIDEVGRGPIAGPVTVAALVIKDKKLLKELQKLIMSSKTVKTDKKNKIKKVVKKKK
jgi:ribonuclease HII